VTQQFLVTWQVTRRVASRLMDDQPFKSED
jgi:hypothetical protein